ncbi:MAG: fluoride efflux transporter CrcB [Planctomycetes bacterium]|nr:fluoride efflux transporter CrcB [Planctomycetota bacterium]
MIARIVEVAIGGSLGATARYLAMELLRRRLGSSYPFGTLFVNVAGCFVLGLVLGYASARGIGVIERHMLLVVGFLGSFTTFSTFIADADALVQRDNTMTMLLYLATSIVLGFGAFLLARSIGRLV